jgi:1,4-dihydroxy-2-naphthoate octaprenyltransferase
MAKKLFLNTFYTVIIIVCLIGAYTYGIEQKQYAYIPVAAFIIVIFIVLKIKILKEIRNTQKP